MDENFYYLFLQCKNGKHVLIKYHSFGQNILFFLEKLFESAPEEDEHKKFVRFFTENANLHLGKKKKTENTAKQTFHLILLGSLYELIVVVCVCVCLWQRGLLVLNMVACTVFSVQNRFLSDDDDDTQCITLRSFICLSVLLYWYKYICIYQLTPFLKPIREVITLNQGLTEKENKEKFKLKLLLFIFVHLPLKLISIHWKRQSEFYFISFYIFSIFDDNSNRYDDKGAKKRIEKNTISLLFSLHGNPFSLLVQMNDTVRYRSC